MRSSLALNYRRYIVLYSVLNPNLIIVQPGTNINDALLDGLDKLLNQQSDRQSSPVVIFLTDGSPTSGVTDTSKILENVQRKGFGKYCNNSLLFSAFSVI